MSKTLTAIRSAWWIGFKSMSEEWGGKAKGQVIHLLDQKSGRLMHKLMAKVMFKKKVTCPLAILCPLRAIALNLRIIGCASAVQEVHGTSFER